MSSPGPTVTGGANGGVAAQEVNLDDMGLTSLDALLPLLTTMSHLRSLSLARNDLHTLPAELSSLTRLERLDLTGNPLGTLADLIPVLSSLVSLRHIKLDLSSPEEVNMLAAALPLLESVNEHEVHRRGTSTPTADAQQEQRDATHAVRTPAPVLPTREAIIELSSQKKGPKATMMSPCPEEPLGDPIEQMRCLAEQTYERIAACIDDAALRQARCAAFAEYAESVVQHVRGLLLAGDEEDAGVWSGEVLRARALLFEYCAEELVRLVSERDGAMGTAAQNLASYATDLLHAQDVHWRRLLCDRDGRLRLMKGDMVAAMREIDALMARLGAPLLGIQQDAVSDEGRKDAAASPGEADGGGDAKAVLPEGQRTLALRQLKSLMQEIYRSKVDEDGRCAQAGLTRETMEQHLYTFFSHRYGLRALVQAWVVATLQAVVQYAGTDSEVTLFAKVLRNEVEEGFRVTVDQLRASTRELLRRRVQISTSPSQATTPPPLSSSSSVISPSGAAMAREGWAKFDGWLSAEDREAILHHMYSDADARFLITKLKRAKRAESTMMRSDKVRYADFVDFLLAFQIDRHERHFLAPYAKAFRVQDTDDDGVISAKAFERVAEALLMVSGSKVPAELQRWRTTHGGTNDVTFSEGVELLRDVLVCLHASHPPRRDTTSRAGITH